MATKKSTLLIALLFLTQYLGSSANEARKGCAKCAKSTTDNYHSSSQISTNASKADRFTRDIFGLAPAFNAAATTSNSIEHKRPEYNSNTSDQTAVMSRNPRSAQKPESIENLRKKLKGDKQAKTEKLDFKQKLLQLNSTLFRHSEPYVVSSTNHEVGNAKKMDHVRKLYDPSHVERREPYVHPGAECNFEKDCRWTWKTDIQNGFVIASSHNLQVNESGPLKDADSNINGKYSILFN